METIYPGQLLTGRKQLMEWTGLSEMQIRRVLNDLEMSGEINRRRTSQFSIITIINWEDYQADNQPITGQQPADNRPTTTSKKAKKAKKAKNIINSEKNLSEIDSQEKLKTSPLEFLFPGDDEIIHWLRAGKFDIQQRILNDNSHHILTEEIKKAFIWQSAKIKRKSDLFLVNWLSNKKLNGFGLNQAQAGFSPQHTNNQSSITENDLKRAKELGIL